MKLQTMTFAPPLAALAIAAGLAACGGQDNTDSTNAAGGGATTAAAEATVGGSFAAVPGAPAAYEDVAGEATLSRADGGTTATIQLTGLEPDAGYTAHLHVGSCGETEPGGPHFKFDPQGSEEPPNEIHLSFTSGRDGSGEAEAVSDREVPAGEAGSIVVHVDEGQRMTSLFVHEEGGEGAGHEDHGTPEGGGEDHSHSGSHGSDKVACADLEGGSAGTESGAAAALTIEVREGEPVGGVQQLEFSAGEQIRFRVAGDEAEEIHVHGYDLSEDIPAGGGRVEFDFPAEIEGIFEVELEARAVLIAELQVNP